MVSLKRLIVPCKARNKIVNVDCSLLIVLTVTVCWYYWQMHYFDGTFVEKYEYVQYLELRSKYVQKENQTWKVWKVWIMHCNENPIYVFPEKELLALSPNFNIHVYLSNLCPGPVHIFSCSRIGRPIVGIYKSLTDTWIWKLGLGLRNSFSENICFKFSVLCLCSVKLIGPCNIIKLYCKIFQFLQIWL